MSQDDVKTMQDAYDAFNRGDIPAVTEAMTSDIEWNEPGGGRAPQGTFTGPQSVAGDVSPLSRKISKTSARRSMSGSTPGTASS